MKRIDWIIGIILLVVLIGAAIYYFFGYKKGKTFSEMFSSSNPGSSIPQPPSGVITDSAAANYLGASNAVDLSNLPYGTLPLKQGDQNQLVGLLQRALNYLGATLTVDGSFGPATKAALQAQVGGATTVTQEVALALATQINNRAGAGNDPLANYITQFLKSA